MAGVRKVAQSLADANLSDCTLKAWIWKSREEAERSDEAELKRTTGSYWAYQAQRHWADGQVETA